MGRDLAMASLLAAPYTWTVAAAAVRGSAHGYEGKPCQDAVAVARNVHGHVCAVVCDGAGSAALSRHGADAVSRHMSSFLLDHASDLLEHRISAKQVIAAARSSVAAQQQAHGGSLGDYACTLVAVLLTDAHVVLVHTGDGLIAHLETSAIGVLSAPENGPSRSHTYFVTSVNAAAHTRVSVLPLDVNTTGFAVLSDGAGDVLYDRRAGSVSPVLEQMASWLGAAPEDEVQKGLQQAIEDHFLSRTHDDCSLILLRRQPAEPWECPVCGRIDLLQEPLRNGRYFLRCPACGFSHLDRTPRGMKYPFLLRQWIRFLHGKKRMSIRQIARLTRVPQATISRWLWADERSARSEQPSCVRRLHISGAARS